MSKRIIVIVAAVCSLALIGVWAFPRLHSQERVTYRFAQVERGTLTTTVSAAGSIISDKRAAVSAQISGTVTSVQVRQGQAVRQGDVLYELNSPNAEADVAAAYSAYVEAKATVEASRTAQLEAEASRTAIEADQSSSPTQKEIARQQLIAAQAAAQAAVQHQNAAWLGYTTARDQAAHRTVRAPIGGTVTSVSIQVGAQAGSGGQTGSADSSTRSSSNTAAATPGGDVVIQDLGSIKVQVAVNEVDISGVSVGQPTKISVESLPDLQLHGTVERLDASGAASQGVVSYQAVIKLDENDDRLRPGMTSSVHITTETKQNVLKVPSSAIHKAADGHYYVETQEGDGRIRQHAIQIGLFNDTDTEIVQGLRSGQRIITQTIRPVVQASGASNLLAPTTADPKGAK